MAAAHDSSAYVVRLSTEVARVLECDGPHGRIEFTVDSGSKGDKSICLEHHPPSCKRDREYLNAFGAAKRFLEACGFEVEVYGE